MSADIRCDAWLVLPGSLRWDNSCVVTSLDGLSCEAAACWLGQSSDGHRVDGCVVPVVLLPDSTLPLGEWPQDSLYYRYFSVRRPLLIKYRVDICAVSTVATSCIVSSVWLLDELQAEAAHRLMMSAEERKWWAALSHSQEIIGKLGAAITHIFYFVPILKSV